MPGRASRSRSSTGSRPRRRRPVVAARIEQHTGPGDVVADLFGRGGWVARAAVDRQRLTVSLESSPLTRMLAEVVLRPPDVRHLDAAFQGMAASPRGDVQPEGLDRRPVRDALRDLQPDPGRRRDRLVGRRRRRDRRAGQTGDPPLPLHGLPRPAWWVRAAPGAARRRRPAAGDGRRGRRGDAGQPARPVPDRARGGGPARRAARPPHRAAAGRSRRHPRADRGRPPRRAGPGRAPTRPSPRDPARQPACDPSRSHRRPAGLIRPRPAAGRDRLPRAQPMARLRGRLPPRPRIHPAPRRGDRRPDPGTPRRGPAQPRRGGGHDA